MQDDSRLQPVVHPKFQEIAQILASSYRLLESSPQQQCGKAKIPRGVPGIYLLSEGQNHLYVGRAKDIASRLELHRWGQDSQATFAFKLAREATGNLKPSYRKQGSRKALMNDADFNAAFIHAKERITGMDVRFVSESDPVRQALLEIYVALVLETPYNDFNTS